MAKLTSAHSSFFHNYFYNYAMLCAISLYLHAKNQTTSRRIWPKNSRADTLLVDHLYPTVEYSACLSVCATLILITYQPWFVRLDRRDLLDIGVPIVKAHRFHIFKVLFHISKNLIICLFVFYIFSIISIFAVLLLITFVQLPILRPQVQHMIKRQT